MSSESSEFDNISSTEDKELTECSRSSDGYSDSESSARSTASRRLPIKQSETDEDKDNDVATTFLNASDENEQEFDIQQASLISLKDISTGDLTRTRRSSSDKQVSVLTKKASSLDSLEGLSTRRVSSLSNLEGLSTRRVSSLSNLEGLSTRRVSSMSHLEGLSTRRVSSLNSLEGPLTRMVSSAGSLEEPLIRRVSSLDHLEKPSTRTVSFLNSLKGPSTKRISSVDSLGEHSIRRNSSLDHLEPGSLEGPSARTVWFSDSAESPLTSFYTSHNLETETNNEPPTQQNVSWFSNFLRRYSRQIRLSRHYPLFNVTLLVIPCSAGYMGSKYQGLCRGCPNLPFLVYMLGILGMWIITIRIVAILTKRYFVPPLTGREFNTWMVSIFFMFFMCLLIEMVTTFICEPVFIRPLHEEFCIKVFYNYAFCLNAIVLLVIVLLLLIHIPSFFDPAEEE